MNEQTTSLDSGRASRRRLLPQAAALAAFLLIPLSVGFIGSALTTSEVDGWYAQADVAPWNPPNWVFGPVWTVLYLTMGFAAWLIWRASNGRNRSQALGLFVAQLVLNSVWTPMFFGGYPIWGTPALWAAMGIILALAVMLGMTMRAFWRMRPIAGILLLPYLGWVLYASTLNLYIALMN